MASSPSGRGDLSPGDQGHRAGNRGHLGRSKEDELKNPRSYRKEDVANRFCEVHATIYLAKGKRIAIDRALNSLLDALGGVAEHTDAIFIRFARTNEKG